VDEKGASFEIHEKWMTVTLHLSVVLALGALTARPFSQNGKRYFVIIFLGLLAVMSIGTDYGTRMVYNYNAGGNVCSQPIDFNK
jgi:hypothetical protein